MTTRKYKNFIIKEVTVSPTLVHVFKDDKLIGTAPDEESARQLIWMHDNNSEFITSEMMEVVEK